MAFKEYSKNDFFYYKFGTTDASCNNVNLDDLIDSSCKSYGIGAIDVSLNGIEYKVTPGGDIDTIREIADKFTEISPYIFSYTSDNKLIVKSAKIKFATAINNSASKFLGYEESNVDHELPYMFPNIIKTTYNPNDGPNKNKYEYNFDSSYNFGPVDIRATEATSENLYYKVTGISINTDNKTNDRYINVYSLIEHLNSKKIGFPLTSPVTLTADINNKLYYKFEYVSMYDKLKVDLMCQETTTLTDNKLTITIDSKEYTYTITKPNDSGSVASTSSDIIYGSSFRYWKTEDTTSKTKINPPTVSFEQKTITGVFNATKKAFVCNILPDFALEFTDTNSSPTLVYSASKYVKHDSKYHTLPKVVSPNSIGSDNNDTGCISAKQQRALCTNKSYADKLMALTGTHPGASERYDNIRSFTSMSILNIFNLGIGILATGVFIAKTYK
jgi:hypothetical protein